MTEDYVVGFMVLLMVVMAVHPSPLLKVVAVSILTFDFACGGGDIFAWFCLIGLVCIALRVVILVLFGWVL